jgi:hypothetical protein
MISAIPDFISYLRIRKELKATREIIGDKEFLKSIRKGEMDFRKSCFKKWSEVKENV